MWAKLRRQACESQLHSHRRSHAAHLQPANAGLGARLTGIPSPSRVNSLRLIGGCTPYQRLLAGCGRVRQWLAGPARGRPGCASSRCLQSGWQQPPLSAQRGAVASPSLRLPVPVNTSTSAVPTHARLLVTRGAWRVTSRRVRAGPASVTRRPPEPASESPCARPPGPVRVRAARSSSRRVGAGSRSSHATSARDFPSGRILAARTGYSEYPKYYSSPNASTSTLAPRKVVIPSFVSCRKKAVFGLVGTSCRSMGQTWVRVPRGPLLLPFQDFFCEWPTHPSFGSVINATILVPSDVSLSLVGTARWTHSERGGGWFCATSWRTHALVKDRPSRALAITCAWL